MRLLFLCTLLGVLLQANLYADTGGVEVYSVPADAKVYIDGIYVGKTPYINVEIPVGPHKVKVYLNESSPSQYWDLSVNKENAQVKTFHFLEKGTPHSDHTEKVQEQSEIKGSVLFRSFPPGAELVVDNGASKRTPYLLKGADSGTYNIEFILDGEILNDTFDVIDNMTITIIADFNEGAVVNLWEKEKIEKSLSAIKERDTKRQEEEARAEIEREIREAKEREARESEERIKKCRDFSLNRSVELEMTTASSMVGKNTHRLGVIRPHIKELCSASGVDLDTEVHVELFNLKGYWSDMSRKYYADIRHTVNNVSKITSSKHKGLDNTNTGDYGDCYYSVEWQQGTNHPMKQAPGVVTFEFYSKDCDDSDLFTEVY